FISAAGASMTLVRTGNPGNTTVTPGTSIPIIYNFSTGYTFNLVCTANSGYYFASPNVGSITSVSGGGTYTINSSSFTAGNTEITMNVTITGVPFGTTSLSYQLLILATASAPKITNNPGFPYEIIGTSMNQIPGISAGNDGSNTSIAVTVTNNTGAPVYIWAGINNYTTGLTTGPGSINVNVPCGYQKFTAPTFNLQVPTTNQITLPQPVFSTNSYTLPNNASITGTLYRASTTDAYHIIRLYWSSTIGGSKQQINT
ncbi:MAG: hypothetical protein ACOVOV_15375, partial [Dolichospermum sp.]